MAYIKKTWMDGDLINASDLNNIENGIKTLEQNTQILGGKVLNVVGESNTFQSGTLLTASNVQDSSKPSGDYMIGGIFGISWTGTDFSVHGAIEDAYRTCIDYDRYLDNPAEILFIADTAVELVVDDATNYLILGSNITMQEAYDELKQGITNSGGEKLNLELEYIEDASGFVSSGFDELIGKHFIVDVYSNSLGYSMGSGIGYCSGALSNFNVNCFDDNKGEFGTYYFYLNSMDGIVHIYQGEIASVDLRDLKLFITEL